MRHWLICQTQAYFCTRKGFGHNHFAVLRWCDLCVFFKDVTKILVVRITDAQTYFSHFFICIKQHFFRHINAVFLKVFFKVYTHIFFENRWHIRQSIVKILLCANEKVIISIIFGYQLKEFYGYVRNLGFGLSAVFGL